MTPTQITSTDSFHRRIALLPPLAVLGFAAALLAVAAIFIISYRSLEVSAQTAERVTHTLSVLQKLEGVVSHAKDLETGQRGFLLTDNETYLDPYSKAKDALPGEVDALRTLLLDSPDELQRVDSLRQALKDKLDELAQTISIKRAGDTQTALAIVQSDRGKAAMDRIRSLIGEIGDHERAILGERQQELQVASGFTFNAIWIGSVLLLALIAIGAWVMSREYRWRETNFWVRSGLMRLNDKIRGEHRLEELGDSILAMLTGYLGACVGAIYVRQGDGRFQRFAGYALPAERHVPIIKLGEGLLGQAARDDRVMQIDEVPADYFPVHSTVGQSNARQLLITPASVDGVVQAVVELGFFRRLEPADREFLQRASESLGIALRAAQDRSQLELLLEETQRQAEELQTQQEELRVSNEELEEQSHLLKESQAQLETQQAELEQINAHLEAQSQQLEAQRDDLAQSQEFLANKAAELQRVNAYKSEFLANMSHELRTPLNSTLILAKLLADNKAGNLTAQQVKFAQTIESAGNDLLALINDILDLSKVEAGKIEILPEPLRLAKVLEGLRWAFEPQAQDKGLEFRLALEPGVPAEIETDNQRLGQILRNLVSNALKFTERGAVNIRVSNGARKGTIQFSVTDSGIGIAPENQELIFDAFRQADGSTHRKYGGTGLGLSISRDLARLLGGDIRVDSTLGTGSTFILTLPVVFAARAPLENPISAAATPTPLVPAPAPPLAIASNSLGDSAIDDDRHKISADSRCILVIEDDLRFAEVLRAVVNESGFLFVTTQTASDGLAAALLYQPKAILLDMNLPDHSGLGVLDQLKRDSKTRHIPVHVISVADYSQEARELGAAGYDFKPIKRDDLVNALRRLEAKISQTVRRVLVVEDDGRQGESIRALLNADDVEITLVQRAADALTHLGSTTFDCIVMDLNLPDMSGYDLLEKMATQDAVSFPPVIVYTGRSITHAEEQALHRYSRSIIIKDARSPERLLDEVTLFLHQVESKLPASSQRLLRDVRNRDATLEGRRVLIVEDDVRNIFALSSVLEPKGVLIEIARNGREAVEALERNSKAEETRTHLVLMDIMMPEMDGIEAMQIIRSRAEFKRLPIIALTAKAMRDDQEKCLAAGANDYIAKPLDVEKLLSLVRVWMPKA
jgi:signal transduction histidine kinase/CheY-like chemotaxis protein/CHASE3 domain sensor protein